MSSSGSSLFVCPGSVCLHVFGGCLYVRGITCFRLGNKNCSFQIRHCHIMKKCPACGRKMSSITKRLIHFLSRNGIFTKKKKRLVNSSSVNLPVVFPFLQKTYSLLLGPDLHKQASFFARIRSSLTARKQIRIVNKVFFR